MTVVHQSVSTATTEESEEVCRQLFPTLRLSGGGALRHTHRVDGDERLLMARLTWSGPVSGRNTPVDELLIVSPLSGKIVWEVGGEEGGFGVPWIQQPGQQAYSAYGPLDTVTASISMESLTATARAVYGDDDLEVRFTGATPTSAAMAKHIAATLLMTQHIAAEAAFEASPLLRANAYRMLAVSILEGFDLEGDRADRTLAAAAQERRYRIARQFFDDNASLPITTDDAAEAAGVTAKQLRTMFRGLNPLGHSPQQYLQNTRLSAAHDALLRGTSVIEDAELDAVAATWGFPTTEAFIIEFIGVYRIHPRALRQ